MESTSEYCWEGPMAALKGPSIWDPQGRPEGGPDHHWAVLRSSFIFQSSGRGIYN